MARRCAGRPRGEQGGAGIPAVRAIVPGLEWVSDFDRFSRLPPRLYAAYLRQFGEL